MHKTDSIGMKLCSLLVCFCLLATIKAVEVSTEVSTEVEVAAATQVGGTITATNIVTGTNTACGNYQWPLAFNEIGRGAVVFTVESVPVRSVLRTKNVWRGFYYDTVPYTEWVTSRTLGEIVVGLSSTSLKDGDPARADPMLEIVLGLRDRRSVVRRSRNGPIIFTKTETGRVVSGGTYWVSLYDNRLRVGTGSQINTNIFIDINLVSERVVNAGQTYPAKSIGFSCRSTAITYTQASLVSDCVVGSFDSGSQCSAICGGGRTTRKRGIVYDVSGAEYGGAVCPSLTQDTDCNTNPCPVDCIMNDWGAWGGCSPSCGGGSQSRTRTTKGSAAFGGAVCPNGKENRACNTQPCPVDCDTSPWSEFGECSEPCGGKGVWTRTATIIRPAQFGGRECSPDSLRDIRPCNTQPCPIDCVQSDWSLWADCSKTCGTGTRQRSRAMTTQPDYGGVPCGLPTEEENCNPQPCPQDCLLTDWTAWGQCDSPCGTGTYTRTRKIEKPPMYGGEACESLEDQGACNTQECPVDRLAVLIKRIRHLELQDRVSSLEEDAIKQAQDSVTKTAFNLAADAATPVVSTISLAETVHHSHTTASQATADVAVSHSQHLSTLHPTLVMAAHPYVRPAITQLLQSEIMVDELAKWSQRQDEIEQRRRR